MKSLLVRVSLGAVLVGLLPVAAMAQPWTPGSEVVGQPIEVTTNGVTNTGLSRSGWATSDHYTGRQNRPRYMDSCKRPALPGGRRPAGVRALRRSVPGGSSGKVDELVWSERELARAVHQCAAATGSEERAGPLSGLWR